MAKKFNVQNAKVEIDGKDGYQAFKWDLEIGVDDAWATITCHAVKDALKLSIKDNPNPNILLVDFRGVALRYFTELIRVEAVSRVGSVDQVEYRFKITG